MKIYVLVAVIISVFFIYNSKSSNDYVVKNVNSVVIDDVQVKSVAPDLSYQKINQKDYKCDGRTHCSQMTSCEEAKFFIQNCPNTQMDGDNDGQPCESQWCKF